MTGSIISQPSVTIALANATKTVENTPQRVLLVGQKVASGTAADGALTQNIASGGSPENTLFGQESQLAAMVRAFKAVNQVVRLDAISLPNGGGTDRVVTATVAGTATGAGEITLVAGSESLHKFTVAIASGDAAADVATALRAAVNADPECPFVASGAGADVVLTAHNAGTVANGLGVELKDVTAPGITLGGVVNTTPGATDPSLTTVFDPVTAAGVRYQGIVWPFADLSELIAFLDARFSPVNDVLDGVGFATLVDSHSDHLTALGLLNSPSVVYFGDKEESSANYKGPALNEPTYQRSAAFAGIRALRLTDEQIISRFVTSPASLDQFGGTALASLPYFNTPLPNFSLVPTGRGWTATEIEQLLDAGGSVIGNNRVGNAAIVGEVATTYKTDSGGNPDPTFGFLNFVDTASNVREYFFNNYKARFAQSRLTEGAVSRGRDMANAIVIRAFTEKLYQDLAGPDFVLVQDGEVAIQFFKNNLTVVLDLASGTVTVTMAVPIVTQLRTIIATIRIEFSTQG